ncbi:MAG TPA: hypothetical protein VK484_04960 [Ferruginibacter sp.]|nr:hypothetical protein [Ferruginibacter sp.]
MKKYLLLITACVAALAGNAQDYEAIKSMLILTQYQRAKDDLDKAMVKPGFTSKPEAFILKATIYASLAITGTGIKNTPAADQLTDEGDAAFRKFRDMDPAMLLLNDVTYQNGPINLYAGYYVSGYNDYTAKKWAEAYPKMKKAVEYSDLLIQKKLVQVPIDTNVLILAAIIAENAGLKEDAVKYYGRIADNKLAGPGFESVYRYLVSYYFQKKELVSFEKYKNYGASVYPQSEFFSYDKVDFAVGLEQDFSGKLKAVENLLLTDPGNYKANQVLGEIIYDELNPREATKALPANANELEKKMIAAFYKAAAAKPGFENPFIYMGDHFINKAVKVNDAKLKAANDPAETAVLELDYGNALSAAKEPYEKAAVILAGRKATLSLKEKTQYRKVAGYLAEIAAHKKVKAKANPAEQKKWADEEAAWNNVANTIK